MNLETTVTATEQAAILSLEDREDSNYPDLIFPSTIFITVPSTLLPFRPGQNCLENKSRFLPIATVCAALLHNIIKQWPYMTLWPCRTYTPLIPGFSTSGGWRKWLEPGGKASRESWGYLSGFCVHTCICNRIRCVKVLKHCPHFQRCQSLNSECSWLVEVGLARTRWFFTLIWLNPDSIGPDLSRREKFLPHGVCGNTMERCWVAGESLLLLLKGCRASCLHMASITVEGTFTGRTTVSEDQFY